MLTGIHILMTYKCPLECDHCFLYSSPRAQGTMTLPQVRSVLSEARRIKSVEWIYFEGGEPFLFYPSLLGGIKLAKEMGFNVGVVTNAYGAISEADADLWIEPLAKLGVAYLSVSDDTFHYGEDVSPAKNALAAARKFGIPTAPICIQEPFIDTAPEQGQDKGKPIVGGGAMFRGRAVEKLTDGLPKRDCNELNSCPHEDFQSPSRVHVDCYGNVQLCQGISMGNMWQRPLSTLIHEYRVDDHPICSPLSKGGPIRLARKYNIQTEKAYVDECHLCYATRLSLIDAFPQWLAPKQVYGITET